MILRHRLAISTVLTALLAVVAGGGLFRVGRTIRSVADTQHLAFAVIEDADAARRLVEEAGRGGGPEVLARLSARAEQLIGRVDSLPDPTGAAAGPRRRVALGARRVSDLVRSLTGTPAAAPAGGAWSAPAAAPRDALDEADKALARLTGDVTMWRSLELNRLRGGLVGASRAAGGALLLLALTSIVVVWWFNRRVVLVLRDLERAAGAVRAGDRSSRVGVRFRGELGAVARAFNRMVEERGLAADRLAASEERLRLALAAANQGLYDIAVQTGEMTVSPEYCRMIGYDPGELQETVAKLHNRLHPDDRDRVVQAYEGFIGGLRSGFAVEFRQRTAYGGFRWVLSVGRIVEWDAAGRPVRMLGTHTDITADREVQEELRASREQLRRLAVVQEAAREAERGRLARELHDELGQALTGLKMDVLWLRDRLPDTDEPGRGRAAEALALVDTTVEAVRRVAAELRPAILDDIGLAAAIPWQAREFARRSGTAVTVTGAESIPAIEAGKATAVFRIVQESLTNVARHSAATAVAIDIRADPDWLRLDIRDNGKGFEAAPPDRRPLGILGMQERARAWDGSVAVTPHPDGGTRVRVLMPVHAAGPGAAETDRTV